MNENEISDYRFLAFSELDDFLKQYPVTPWFKLIYKSGLLSQWWGQLIDHGIDNVKSGDSIKLLE